jgi:hypothetical protein
VLLATGVVTTLAGGGGGGGTASGRADGVGLAAAFDYPYNVAVAPPSLAQVFIADLNNNLIRTLVLATGVVTTLAGGGSAGGAASGSAGISRCNAGGHG